MTQFNRRTLLQAIGGGIAAGALSPFSALAAPPKEIIMGCANATSSHYALGVAMSQAIKANLPGSNVTLLETGGGLDNLRRLARSEVQLGQIGFDSGILARRGVGPFQDKGIPDVVVLYPYGISFSQIIARKDSGVTSLEDLHGKPFSAGIRGSSSEVQVRTALDLMGIQPKYVPGNLADATEGVQNRQLAGMAVSTAGAAMTAAVRELSVHTQLVSIPVTKAQWAKVDGKLIGVELRPIPASASPNKQEVGGLGFRNVWVTRLPLMDDETAYEIAKAIYTNRRMLFQAWPHLEGNIDFKDLALTAEAAGIPLHPGAQRYWKSI